MRLGEEEHHSVGIHRRLAHRRNIKRYHIRFWSNFDNHFSLKHSTVLTSQQPLRFLGKQHLQTSKWETSQSVWILIDITSTARCWRGHLDISSTFRPRQTTASVISHYCNTTLSTPMLRRPPAQQDSHLDPDRHHIYRKVVGMLIWTSQVRPDLQFTAKDHTRHLSSPTEWHWQHLKHTQVHQRNHALQVPHLTSATSRSLTTSLAVDASSHQHLL